MRTAIRRIVGIWFLIGAVAAVLTGLLFVSVPSNQSSSHRLILLSSELIFAAVLLCCAWRLWRGLRFAVPVGIFVLLAQVPAFYGVGAAYQCAAPVGVYARVYLFSGGHVEHPFLRRVQAAPPFLPPIEGYYFEPYAGCGVRFASQDPPLDSPTSFGWISVNLPAVFFLLVALGLYASADVNVSRESRIYHRS